LFFHNLGALTFFAGIAVAGSAFEAARRRESPAEIALLLGLTRVGVVLVILGGLLLLGCGLWLVHLGGFAYGAIDGTRSDPPRTYRHTRHRHGPASPWTSR